MLALTACASAPALVPPRVVRVPVLQYVPVPAALTDPVPVARAQSPTVGEAVRVARARRAAIETCNAQMDAIRALDSRKLEPSS